MLGRELFDVHLAGWLSNYLEASGAGARYPGQRAAECERERGETGIPLSAAIVDELVVTGALVCAPFDLDPL
jgi:LDH2 family malate/lactate/ureidoglycolate dehydrogenase